MGTLAPMADSSSRLGARYTSPDLLRYVESLHAAHDSALAAAFTAPEREGLPSIQLGPSEARLIELLVRIASARRAVEIGTLAGYSAIRLARGLTEGGRLWTLEKDPRHAEMAQAAIDSAGLSDRVEIVVGDAVERLSDLDAHAPFDAVFVDADKGRYDVYGRWAAAHLRVGGLLIADNVYYFGRLLDEHDPDAAAMRRFHEEACIAFDTVCIPTPDGLLLGAKR